ncbi:MAG TPA: hypothetical protein DHW40_10650 [Microbacterium sp.]|nr:hypothetical protein [Microbacterium sp.]
MSRVAIVTGGTRGIGRAICERLRDERGFTIIANYAGNDDAARRFTEETGIATARFDVGDHDAVIAACEAIEAEHGAIDVVVNNAGITRDGTLLKMSYEDWDAVMRTNLGGCFNTAKATFAGMKERGWGRIVNIASESGVNVPAEMIPYGVTKAAMIALGNGLAKLTRGAAVTVNTVLGGPTYSDGVASVVESLAAAQGAPAVAIKAAVIGENRTSLLERFIEPAEIASLVAYLASPLASATNGAALRADGGVLTTTL